MPYKVSFYGYLFTNPADSIVRYDILWKSNKKFLLKSTVLDRSFKSPTEDIVVMIYSSLYSCIEGIIGRFRNTELEMGLYKGLKPVIELDPIYQPLITELETAISSDHITSFSMFGNIRKYKPQTQAREFLKSMGYLIITTRRPHLYVLDEFIRKEFHAFHHNAADT